MRALLIAALLVSVLFVSLEMFADKLGDGMSSSHLSRLPTDA